MISSKILFSSGQVTITKSIYKHTWAVWLLEWLDFYVSTSTHNHHTAQLFSPIVHNFLWNAHFEDLRRSQFLIESTCGFSLEIKCSKMALKKKEIKSGANEAFSSGKMPVTRWGKMGACPFFGTSLFGLEKISIKRCSKLGALRVWGKPDKKIWIRSLSWKKIFAIAFDLSTLPQSREGLWITLSSFLSH